MDSSSTVVCSLEEPCLDGNSARDSFSTYRERFVSHGRRGIEDERPATYIDLKVDIFLGKGAHLVAEAERVVTSLLGSESKVTLALLFTLKDNLAVGALHNVVDIERTTGLDLDKGQLARGFPPSPSIPQKLQYQRTAK